MWSALVLQLIVVVLATRLYLARRSLPFLLLLAACVAYVISHSAWFTFNFVAGFLRVSPAALHTIRLCTDVTGRGLSFLFPVFLILSLVAFTRDRAELDRQPSNHALQPTAGRSDV